MIVCEALLLTNLFVLLVNASYTDCKESIVRNSDLVKCGIVSIVLDLIYYGFFARGFLGIFATNLLLLTIIVIAFYGYHLWAAGDSKLLFVVALCVPGRFYSFWDIGRWSSFAIVIFTFSIAFIYVIVESIYIGIKNRDLFRIRYGGINLIRGTASYLFMVGATIVVNLVLSLLIYEVYTTDTAFSTAVNFIVVLSLMHLRDKINTKALIVCTGILWIGILALYSIGIVTLATSFDIRSWLLVLAIMFVRMIAEKYNYKAIPTSEVKHGQILSAMTVIGFKTSRVQGLPSKMTEDLQSRITAEEADSIRRWEKSVHGQPYIIIVRKIPFAAFIAVGTLIFLIIEVVMQ